MKDLNRKKSRSRRKEENKQVVGRAAWQRPCYHIQMVYQYIATRFGNFAPSS